MRLSIAIPIYNFANFITETLDSIVAQDRVDEVEIVVVDGASTDATPQVMEAYRARHPQVKYVRLPAKGGIDRDMATAFSLTSGDYCWLFSGDDIMRRGALARALEEIESGCDVYLARHMEFLFDQKIWAEWPVLAPNVTTDFELSDPAQRARYFESAVNTEPFFSFMGGMVTRRTAWDRVPFNGAFDGSCWAHAARFFELMKSGLRLRYVAEAWQDRRPDNDSFMGRGFVARIALSIDGYHRIADTFFGHDSLEAFHVRRVVRKEFGIGMLVMAKFLCMLDPDVESRAQLDALVAKAYCDPSYENWRLRWKYFWTRAATFRKWQPELATKQEELVAKKKAVRQKT
jgi:abequosyltransferase